MHQFRKKYIVLRFLFDQKCVKESKKVLNWQNVDRCKKSSILRPLVYIDEQKRASFQNLTQAIYLIQPQNWSQQLLSLSSCRQGYHVNVSFFYPFLNLSMFTNALATRRLHYGRTYITSTYLYQGRPRIFQATS